MAIDIALLLVLCFGIYKGYSKGLIISVFAALAWVLGVIVAMHFVTYGTSYLQKTFKSHSVYLYFLSFFLIFIVVVIVIYFVGKLLEKIIDIAQLGLANKISGAVLISVVYIFLFSTLLWICSHAGFITPEMIKQSKSYNLVEPVSEDGIQGLSSIFPTLKSTYDKVGKLLDEDTMSLSKH
jgi:membrane protein required for colicin V production